MQDQAFTHENELLAMAPLNGDEDTKLFKKQSVHITGAGDVQWDFTLHDGRDWHFRESMHNLRSDGPLRAFKQYIRDHLTHITEAHSG